MHILWALFILQFGSYEIALSWCLWWTSFPICILIFNKISLTISSSNKYPQCWSFKLAKSNQFKADIKSRLGLTWNADMWLINLPKTLSPIQMSHQIAKFNTWKRWILHQHNINVITTYFKYLIWQLWSRGGGGCKHSPVWSRAKNQNFLAILHSE